MTASMWLMIASVSLAAAVALSEVPLRAGLALLNARAVSRFGERLQAVAIDVSHLPEWLIAWRALIVAVVLFVGVGMRMMPVALFLGLLAHQSGPITVEYLAERRRKRLSELTASAARGLAGQVRVGVTLGEALESVAKQSPAPLGPILSRSTRQLAQGRSTRDVLTDLKSQVRIEGMNLLTTALLVASENGGRLAEVLNRISDCLEESQRIQRKRESDTAAGRMMVLVMGIFPVAFMGFVATLDPEMVQTLFTPGGQVLIAVSGLMTFVAVQWARSMLAKTR